MSASFGFISDNQESIVLILLVVVVFLALISAYLHLEVSKLKKNAKVLFSGKNASNLEDIILSQVEKSKELENAITGLKDADQRILDTLSRAVQKVGIIRFNPFGDVGGNQSFTVALLDNYNSGVIILSLYSREGVRIYGKAISEGKCEYQLSKEEEDALQMAMKR
ncbi:MAG: DUF4446 family protein [Candidatus Pacebacteria bacterium]|nr:DUF4446 family protein [Candidatus Paceibacterota bacterium]